MHLNIFKNKVLPKGIIVTLLSFLVLLWGSQPAGFDYQFIQDPSGFQNGYSFRGSFRVKAEMECLLHVIFDFEHLARYTAGAKSIELIRQGENWNEVTYTYRKFLIFENKSTWRRTLKQDEQKVTFEMLLNQNNLKLLPEVSASAGYYQVQAETTGYRVTYFQTCQLKAGLLRESYMHQAKKAALEFLQEFKAYIEKTCH